MIVKYVRERGKYAKDEIDPWLALGKEYIVLTLDYRITDGFQFSLLSDNENGPGVWNASFFDIVDTRVPEDFIFEFSEGGGYACLQPKEFGGDFWDLYHDSGEETAADVVKRLLNNGDKEVYKTFADVVKRLRLFHNWPVEKEDYLLPYAERLSANRFLFEVKQLIDSFKTQNWNYQSLSDVMEKLIAKITPEENPLRIKVLDVWAVIFNQSLDTPNESVSAPHQQLVEDMLKK